MIFREQQSWLRLRAALLALVLVLGWSATPAALLAAESDVCEMECCVADGHCCCAAQRTYVAGQIPDGGDVITSPQLFAPCPANCAAASAAPASVARTAERPPIRAPEFATGTEANFARSTQLHPHPELTSGPSRAPPTTIR